MSLRRPVLVSNDLAAVKHTVKDMGKVFKGVRWKPGDYRDLLCLLFELIRVARANPVGLEEHVERPQESAIFARYPRILHDHEAVDLICDTMRVASLNYDDPHQVEEVLDKRMEAAQQHALHSSHACNPWPMPCRRWESSPPFCVIKTMGSLDQPPEILGQMIGSALVGTFLGVFLAYGIMGPFAARVKSVVEGDAHFYQLIRVAGEGLCFVFLFLRQRGGCEEIVASRPEVRRGTETYRRTSSTGIARSGRAVDLFAPA